MPLDQVATIKIFLWNTFCTCYINNKYLVQSVWIVSVEQILQCCNICSYHRVINENNFCKLLPLAEFFIRNMKTRKFELMLMRGVSRLISSPRTNIFHTLLVCRLHWFWIDYTILSTYIYKSSCTHVNIKGTRIILVTRGLQQLTLQCPAFIKTLLD